MNSRQLESPIRPIFKSGLPFVAILVVVVLLWLPMGFTINDRVEGWTIMRYLSDPSVPIHPQSIGITGRPLLIVPWAIGAWLTPDSFLGTNLVNIVVLWLKGCALYALILMFFPRHPAMAFLIAVLWLVYPSDIINLDTRGLGVHWGATLCLFAIWCYYRWWTTKHPLFMGLAWLTLGYCFLFFDPAYPLVAAAPALLPALRRGTRGEYLRAGIYWYWVPAVTFIRFITILITGQAGYVGGLLSVANVGDMIASVVNAYYMNLVRGWIEVGLPLLNPLLLYLGLGMGIAFLVGMVSFRLFRQSDQRAAVPRRKLIRSALVGLMIILIGFLMYVPTIERWNSWRVYVLPSIGGALFFGMASLILTASMRPVRRVISLFLIIILIEIGVLRTYALSSLNAGFANFQRFLLTSLVHEAPSITPNTLIILLYPDAAKFADVYFYGTSVHFEDAIRYLYQDSTLHFTVCLPDALPYGKNETCRLESTQVTMEAMGETIVRTYDQVIFLTFDPERGLEIAPEIPQAFVHQQSVDSSQVYSPQKRLLVDRKPSERMRQILGIQF